MRKHWIDNLRWVTVLLVLIYHVFYYYNNKGVFGGIGGFGGEQPQDVVLYILYPWFMMLLFLVAGISARYSLQKRTNKEFISSRTTKLLVPSTIGLLVFQWMVGYYNTLGAGEALASVPGPALYLIRVVSGIGPLWFAQDLWLFSLLLILIKKIDGKDRFWNWCGKASVPVIILLGIVVFLAAQVLIYNPNPQGIDGLFNLYKPVVYFVVFLLGYFVFSHDEVQEKVGSIAVPMIVCAAVSGIALVWTTWGQTPTAPKYMASWLNNLYAWTACLAMLGGFQRWGNGFGKFSAYMTRTSYGLYVDHYLVLASVGYFLKMKTTLPPVADYAILMIAVLVLSPAIYEVLHRIPFIRWAVFGEKKAKK